MSISTEAELKAISRISEVVATTLKSMVVYARPGMNAKELDEYGGYLLTAAGARSAPKVSYNFPGYTCISINEEVAHRIPSANKVLKEGDLINIDVSSELDGFWSDNGCSFILGKDLYNRQPLVDASKKILYNAISQIKGGVKIADIGKLIETEAKKAGYKVIRNLTGHGIGRSLHEEPHEIASYYDRENKQRFRKNSVVAIETFISTRSSYTEELSDGWTMVGRNGGFVAQHEHTIIITDGKPIILTASNGIWDIQ
jgi:methionyl aminopeptidase